MDKVEKTKEIRCNQFEKASDGLTYAVAYQGSDHLKWGTPCQDYCGFKRFSNGVSIFAISDGHGSVPRSEHGSKFAIETIISLVEDCVKNNFSELDIVRYFREDIGRLAIINGWKNKIAEDWAAYNTDPNTAACTDDVVDMYGATLIFCIVLPKFILTGFVGDGALVLVDGKTDEALPVLAALDDVGESTLSLSHQRPDFFDIRLLNRKDYDYVLLSTDGLAKPYGEVIFEVAKNCAKQYKENADEMKLAIDNFMEKSHPAIGDDISLVFGTFEVAYVEK